MPKNPEQDKEFISLALERWEQANEAEADAREECLEDLKFSIGDQWPEMIKSARALEGRPMLTMDQTGQSVQLVCNNQRQQRPSIKVNPVGNGADVESAEIWTGIIRHIEVQSDAELAYDESFEYMVRCGRGHFRLMTEYCDDDSGNQDIVIKPIENTFSVYYDPSHKKAWCFIIEDLTRAEYVEQYPDSDLAGSWDTFQGRGDTPKEWLSKDGVRIAEYYRIEETPRRKGAPKKKVIWCKINAFERIDRDKTIPGKRIPIIPVLGKSLHVDGKHYLAGLIRNAKGPQRQYNFMVSAATETIALAPKSPFVVEEGQIENHENEWKTANTKNWSVLQYKGKALDGHLLPIPARQGAEPPIQAMSHMIQQAGLDLKASIGLYDPSLGQRKGDESGIAINKLQQQGDQATFNYSDNLTRSMRAAGRILIDWIPVYYDTPRVQRIIKPDGTSQHVVTHMGADQQQDAQEMAEERNIAKIYDLKQGTYDITIEVGPSYQTKRQEAVATQLELVKADPNILPLIGDLLVGEMDIPNAKEIAKRLHAVLPPQVLAADDPTKQGQQLQAQVTNLTGQLQQTGQLLQQAHQVIQTKQVEQQGKKDIAQMQETSKLAIVKMQELTKLAVAQMNASKDAHQEFAQMELDQYGLAHQTAHEVAMDQIQKDHEQKMAAAAAQNAAAQQQGDQAHEVGMAAAGAQTAADSQQADQAHQAEMAKQAVANRPAGE
jgi:Phage P22-like portal protein